jgi:16S rRNA (guanine(966)-N(2))-methyltransferase RsmD
LRISAGEAKGRRIQLPKGGAVRPTQDRVREAVFNALGDRVVGARVLDLFAGAGTLGIEALSRGADRVVFVERDPRTAEVLRGNLVASGFAGRAEVWRSDALRAVRLLGERGESFDLAFCDPPYGAGWVDRALAALARSRVVSPAGVVVVEAGHRDTVEAPAEFRVMRRRTYGDTLVVFLGPAGDGG